ncbi:MAG: YicC family protein [Ruminococcaceae bacterium]|nr:YicC family protein [Oscillospiraceae bacterium]
MAKSMTAYGRATDIINGKEILVEIKSVNSRYLDCTVKISRLYSYLEERAKAYLAAKGITRGKIDLYIGVNLLTNKGTEICLDEAFAESYIAALRKLRDRFDLADDISVMSVARNSEIFAQKHPAEDEEEAWGDILPVLDEALNGFLSMREREGENLKRDLLAKKEELVSMVEKVALRAEQYTAAYRTKLETRLRNVLSELNVSADEGRILTECAIFADRTAVDEELVRLRSHFTAYDEIFASAEPIGRKLDFLLQEMNRETNTIGSKCNDKETSAMVVEMKCLLEKIREQIQNIE